MRKLFAGGLVAALALAVAAVAFGATTQNYTQYFAVPDSGSATGYKEVQKPSRSVGTAVDLSSGDPDNPKNGQPDALRRLDLDFPAGTRIDPSAARQCNASKSAIEQNGADGACPASSLIGEGSATAKFPAATAPNGTPLPDPQIEVDAYNRKGGLLLSLQPTIGTARSNPIYLYPTWRGRLSNGPVLRTDIPPNCYPPAQNVNGVCRDPSTGAEGDEIILNSFKLVTKSRTKRVTVRRGGRRVRITKAMIKTPARCPSGGWEFIGRFTFKSGQNLTLPVKDNCTR